MTSRGPSASAPASPAGRDPRWLRAGLLLLLLAWWGAYALWPKGFFFLGVHHVEPWFADSYAILASNDAAAAGLDPHVPNPLDVFRRPHVYPEAWLHLRHLGLTRADNFPLGVGVVAAFLAAAVAGLRPRSWHETLWYLSVLGAPGVLLAVDRANNDLVVFALLAPVVPCLLAPSRVLPWAGLVLVTVAAALKFYPAVAMLLMLAAADRRTRFRRATAGALALAVLGLALVPDWLRLAPLVPKAEGLMTFGAGNLQASLGVPTGMAAVLVALAATTVWRRGLVAWRQPNRDREWMSFILGAALLTGCFFTAANYAYRWVFAIWLAPFLWRAARSPEMPATVRRLGRGTSVLLLGALWGDSLFSLFLGGTIGRLPPERIMRLADGFFRYEQPLTWAFFGCLMVFLIHFAMSAWRADRREAEPAKA